MINLSCVDTNVLQFPDLLDLDFFQQNTLLDVSVYNFQGERMVHIKYLDDQYIEKSVDIDLLQAQRLIQRFD